ERHPCPAGRARLAHEIVFDLLFCLGPLTLGYHKEFSMRAVPWYCVLVVWSLLTAGCQNAATDKPKASAPAQPPSSDPVAGQPDEEDSIRANLAKLSPEDQKLAEGQRFCAVMNANRLGSMGAPVRI